MCLFSSECMHKQSLLTAGSDVSTVIIHLWCWIDVYIVHICLQGSFAVTTKAVQSIKTAERLWKSMKVMKVFSHLRSCFVYILTQQILRVKISFTPFNCFPQNVTCIQQISCSIIVMQHEFSCREMFHVFFFPEVKQHLNIWRKSSRHFNHPSWHLNNF